MFGVSRRLQQDAWRRMSFCLFFHESTHDIYPLYERYEIGYSEGVKSLENSDITKKEATSDPWGIPASIRERITKFIFVRNSGQLDFYANGLNLADFPGIRMLHVTAPYGAQLISSIPLDSDKAVSNLSRPLHLIDALTQHESEWSVVAHQNGRNEVYRLIPRSLKDMVHALLHSGVKVTAHITVSDNPFDYHRGSLRHLKGAFKVRCHPRLSLLYV